MKKSLLMFLCVILVFSSIVWGNIPSVWEKDPNVLEQDFESKRINSWDGFDIIWRTTFASRYKSVGRSKFGEEGLFHNGITLDFKNNFLFDVASYHSMGRGYEDGEKFSYTLYYKKKWFEGEKYEVEMKAKHLFYDFVGGDRDKNYQETGAKFSFTNLFNFGNGDKLIPSYYPLLFWKHSGRAYNGTAHIFGLDYVKKIDENIESKLFCDLVYNDSIGNSKSAVSHSTVGVAVDIKINKNISVIPFYGYQFSFEKDIVGDSSPCFGLKIIKRF